MSTINSVTLLGFVGNSPMLFTTPGGKSFCLLYLATDESYLNNEGEKVKLTEWHRIVCWDLMAKNSAKYLNKGRQILIRGKLRTKTFTKDNIQKTITEIIAQDIQYLGGVQKAENVAVDVKRIQDEIQLPV